MRQGLRQQVAGVFLNGRPNVGRAERKRLEAILTNCVRHGRIAYVGMLDPAQGERLRALFERIDWGKASEEVA